MKARSLLLAGVAALGLALTACSPPAENATTTGTTTTTGGSGTPAKKFKIAVSIPAADHGWTAGIGYWANKLAKDHEAEAEITVEPAKDADAQVKSLETLATQGYDALVVLPTEPEQVTPTVKRLADSFGYMVAVDRGLTEPIADVWVRGDNKEFGRKAATYMAEKLGGKGNILIFQGIPCPIDTDRVGGFNEVISKSPGIKVLDSKPGMWNREESYKVAQSLLIKHPQVDAIWASDDDMAVGIEKALKEAGRDKNVWMLGGGGMKEVVKFVMDGNPLYPATVTYSPKMIADAIERCITDLKAGKKHAGNQEDQMLPIDVVTPDNAKDFYFPDSIY